MGKGAPVFSTVEGDDGSRIPSGDYRALDRATNHDSSNEALRVAVEGMIYLQEK